MAGPIDKTMQVLGSTANPRSLDVLIAALNIDRVDVQQLAVDGILIAPIGRSSHDQVIVRYWCKGCEWETENLWPVRFVPLLDGTVNDVKSVV